MTSKLLSNISLSRTQYVVSVAILSATFCMGTAMAAGGSTPIQGLDGAKPVAEKTAPVIKSITASPAAECPLNSGGPTLLGTTWRLESIYGNRVPKALKIDMRVSTTSLTGIGGCNKYSANFSQVGYTGFTVKAINKTKKKCKVIIPYKTAKSINVGSWEGSYLRTLRRMGSVRQMTDTKLYFFNRNGQIGMKFHKTADENKEAAAAAEKAAKLAVDRKSTELAAAKRRAEMSRKLAAQQRAQQLTIKKSSTVQKAIPQKAKDKPIISKINASDDDLITDFFKAVDL
ncbi:MAG: META domain-containing protein [Cocleimonas sp.]|nr:META domain-containing protein [Cocleimonas sp.]